MLASGGLTGLAKKKEVGRLLKYLEDAHAGRSETPQQLLDALIQLKVYGRDPKNAEPIYCRNGISTLAKYAFANTTPVSREALRCIANGLLLEPSLRQVFLDLGLIEKAAERLRSEDYDDEFLTSRIIFLLTYGTNLDLDNLLRNLSVASTINANLIRHAQIYNKTDEKDLLGGMSTTALSETLKLLFNLSARQDNALLFQPSLRPMLSILSDINVPDRCLDPPIGLLINALVNIDLASVHGSERSDELPPSPEEMASLVDKLIGILERSLISYKETELETLLPPLLTDLRKIYDGAQDKLKGHMQNCLLPLNEDRDVPIGRSDALPSRLLRLSSSAMAPKLREIIPALMFELSSRDPKKFIENIGYGFAAGFLASHNIAVPESAKQVHRDPERGTKGPLINPITGQRLDMEPEDTGPPMTEEEKEREAERLFVLFERLKATGVVNVQNPVHQAMNDGTLESRIEELDSSD